ncbi:hypothetical protein [Promicromonospora soli]|nr:hypothetical protein [Promicromonospora soli]
MFPGYRRAPTALSTVDVILAARAVAAPTAARGRATVVVPGP